MNPLLLRTVADAWHSKDVPLIGIPVDALMIMSQCPCPPVHEYEEKEYTNTRWS